jgi:hypothetical protein
MDPTRADELILRAGSNDGDPLLWADCTEHAGRPFALRTKARLRDHSRRQLRSRGRPAFPLNHTGFP